MGVIKVGQILINLAILHELVVLIISIPNIKNETQSFNFVMCGIPNIILMSFYLTIMSAASCGNSVNFISWYEKIWPTTVNFGACVSGPCIMLYYVL